MHQIFFTIRLRRFTQLGFLSLVVFFAFLMGASAQDNCPKPDDHAISAVKYQLFAAYQTGFDGHQAPCEIKCFGNEPCLNTCQTKRGLKSLSTQLTRLMKKKNLKSCASYTMVCLKQCLQHGNACNKACNAPSPVASTN